MRIITQLMNHLLFLEAIWCGTLGSSDEIVKIGKIFKFFVNWFMCDKSVTSVRNFYGYEYFLIDKCHL